MQILFRYSDGEGLGSSACPSFNAYLIPALVVHLELFCFFYFFIRLVYSLLSICFKTPLTPIYLLCHSCFSIFMCVCVAPLSRPPPSAVVFCVMAAIFMASKSFVLPTRFGLLEPATAAIYDHGEDSASALASESDSHLDFVSLG